MNTAERIRVHPAAPWLVGSLVYPTKRFSAGDKLQAVESCAHRSEMPGATRLSKGSASISRPRRSYDRTQTDIPISIERGRTVVLALLGTILLSGDMGVVGATDSLRALRKCREGKADTVLLKLMTPDLEDPDGPTGTQLISPVTTSTQEVSGEPADPEPTSTSNDTTGLIPVIGVDPTVVDIDFDLAGMPQNMGLTGLGHNLAIHGFWLGERRHD